MMVEVRRKGERRGDVAWLMEICCKLRNRGVSDEHPKSPLLRVVTLLRLSFVGCEATVVGSGGGKPIASANGSPRAAE